MKIDLGCGANKQKGYIGVDILDIKGVDVVHDCEKGLPFENNSADEILSMDFLEHIRMDKVIFVMEEIYRVLRPNGILRFKIPDAEKGQGAFQDPMHKSFWVRNTFKYYEDDNYYNKMYGIKARFKIAELESVKYESPYWGKNYALVGHLIAVKDNQRVAENNNVILNPNIIYITDDVCPSNLKYWKHWLEIKQKYPDIKIIAFVIANYRNKENVAKSKEFQKWFEENKNWVTIGVHGHDHLRPQECWRKDQEIWIKKARDILKPYLPERYLYRPPGFRTLARTEGILKELGFAGIAHQARIKYFDGQIMENIFNTHCSNKYFQPIINWKNFL